MSIKGRIKEILLKMEGEDRFINRFAVKLLLMRKIGFPLYLTNFFFQRILRNQSEINFSVHFTSKVSHIENIKIHYDLITLTSFAVSGNCYIQAYNGLICGKNFLFAPGVKIITSGHDFKDISKPTKNEPVIFGDNVWIGANVVILPGVRVGNNCVIGAGSVVTKSFVDDNLIIAGNPAKVISKREE
ncbi:MAG: acyltransferase [Calditerrivibrio sp.]|uniref:acyltransferase n=1 Tax=Calditerrivibrio sp. TaxID=2792612 RepID=UPI003D130BA4